MRLLKGTITKLKREIEIKSKMLERAKAKRDAMSAAIEEDINELAGLSKLIAEAEANQPQFVAISEDKAT